MRNRIPAGLAAAAGALAAWGIYENTALLRVQEYRVPIDGFPRSIVLSDLHKRRFGKDQCRLLRLIGEQQPDCIFITGDLISRTVRDLTETEKLLSALRRLAPVLAVPGNHEADLPPALYADYRRMMQDTGITYLENRTVTLGKLHIAGLSLPRAYYRGGGRFGFTGRLPFTADTLSGRLGTCRENTVLLAHNPLWFRSYAEWGAALTLSGHVHGGAVRLPLIGGLLSPERTFFPPYDKGYYTDGRHDMIVSGGLGKLRLFNPPEILLLHQ